jgi:hypothetical protein
MKAIQSNRDMHVSISTHRCWQSVSSGVYCIRWCWLRSTLDQYEAINNWFISIDKRSNHSLPVVNIFFQGSSKAKTFFCFLLYTLGLYIYIYISTISTTHIILNQNRHKIWQICSQFYLESLRLKLKERPDISFVLRRDMPTFLKPRKWVL